MNPLRRAAWSPTVAGALLGLVVAVSLAFGHRLSGAGGYQHLAAPLTRALAPRSSYAAHVLDSGLTWDVLVLLGELLGGAASAAFAGTFRVRVRDRRAMPESTKRRWIEAFSGATVSELGAGLAGGCTASLALSGGIAGAPGAFVFMAGMFAGGIPVAWLREGRRR